MKRSGRLWRTLRPLPARMIAERARYEARTRLLRSVAPLTAWMLPSSSDARIAVHVQATASEELANRAEVMLRTGRVAAAGATVPVDAWDDHGLPRLVRYHLHYLDSARELVRAGCALGRQALTEAGLAIIQQWDHAHPLRWSEGWEPYPVASRLVSLSWVGAFLGPAAPGWLAPLIERHALYLVRWPEEHLRGNHLWRDWAAVALAGAVLESPGTAELRAAAEQRLRRLTETQILSDGGHYERSAMYHFIALEDLLDVRDLLKARGFQWPWLQVACRRMAEFGARILHPDGEVPFFNDAVIGQAPPPESVLTRAGIRARGEAGVFDAPEYGLTICRSGRDALLVDGGPLGPDEQPGHSHSDTASFELSLDGERRVVNGGVDGYQSDRRTFFRSAAAHNTVTVDGEGPDEVWSAFRLGGRSKVIRRSVRATAYGAIVEVALTAHQGWTQERKVLLFHGRALVVMDRVSCVRASEVVSRVRIAGGRAPLRVVPLKGALSQGRAPYAPRFGELREIDEWRLSALGKVVDLAYAIVWSDVSVKLEGTKLVVGELQIDL